MTMKHKVATAMIALSLVGATQVFASGCDKEERMGKNDRSCETKRDCDGPRKGDRNCDMPRKGEGKNCDSGPRGGMYEQRDMFIARAVYKLDLTSEQKEQVKKILVAFQAKRDDVMNAFTKEGFDKEQYIKARTDRKEQMLKARADMIEALYGVLTASQKEKLYEKIQSFKKRD